MNLKPIDSLTASHMADLHRLFQAEWWTKERTIDDVREMVAHSTLVFGFADPQGRLIAFCRLLTDFVFRATLYDVIVEESYRGQGLGRLLIDRVMEHPKLQRVSVIWLCCQPEMMPFYEQWGFVEFAEGPVWMLKAQRPG